MRLKYLNADDCERRYTAEIQRIGAFEVRGQSSWYFQANALVRLAQIAYAVGRPLAECRSWFRQATGAYHELFALRGTSFSKQTRFIDGKALPEETVANDGYTSVDSFNAALVSLSFQDITLAHALVELAGHSPSAYLVSPQSEVCTTNAQTLSHALNALIASDLEIAHREATKLTVRRATKIEQQIALMISAIATDGDVLTERDALLYYHAKLATRRDNHADTSLWLSLPALALTFLAMHFRHYDLGELETDSVYCPIAMLLDADTHAE